MLMKINLWMIVNRLSKFEIECHIPEKAPRNLYSARLAITPDCLYIYQKNNNVYCDAGQSGGYIVFKNDSCDQIFNLLQDVFDDYQKWEDEVNVCLKSLDYQLLIEKSWRFFQNPIVLLNGSNQVLYMSSQYGENGVNDDWKYLKKYGHSSVGIIDYMMSSGKNHEYYMNQNAQIFRKRQTMRPGIKERRFSAAFGITVFR